MSTASIKKKLAKFKYRIVVMGAAGVGKSCLISRFLYDSFVSEYKATVEEFHSGIYDVGASELTLDIIDTSGSFSFPAMRRLAIDNSDAFILVFSVNDELSFQMLSQLREEILSVKHNAPIVVVGNKIDDESSRTVMTELAESISSFDWDNGYVEVSAKDDVNVTGVFKEVLKRAKCTLSPTFEKRRQSISGKTNTHTDTKKSYRFRIQSS